MSIVLAMVLQNIVCHIFSCFARFFCLTGCPVTFCRLGVTILGEGRETPFKKGEMQVSLLEGVRIATALLPLFCLPQAGLKGDQQDQLETGRDLEKTNVTIAEALSC
jgi:hypothetical protein